MSRGITRWLLCLLLVVVAWPAGAQTRAWLDRAEITVGEVVALNIATDQRVEAIDDAPLRVQFDIGGQSVRRNTVWENGHGQSSTVFAVGLRPRGPGIFEVPALRVGGAMTRPLRLVVHAAAVAPASADADVFVETDVDASRPYVQQSVGVTVRLHYAVPLLSGQLDLEAPAHASLQRVGEDITYPRLLGGRRYNVVERRYLLVPERSGPLLLAGARLNGLLANTAAGGLFMEDTRPVAAAAPARALQVLPVPAGAPTPWLPLHAFTLRYLQQPRQAWTGQAATVDVEAVADGATAAQMPALEWPATAGVQVFPEPPQVEEGFVNGRPRATVRRRFALVPGHAGQMLIPGPRVRWWNADLQAARVAELPPLQLQVVPGAVPVGGPAPATLATVPKRAVPIPPRRQAWGDWAWGWLAWAVILPVAWLAWGWRRRAVSARRLAPTAGPTLAEALRAGGLTDIAQALAHAARVPGDDMEAVCRRLPDAAQADAVRQMQAARWGQGDPQEALQALRKAFSGGARWRRTHQGGKSLLPPLYPD